jgi:energy-coupling factor transporter transmembrane protein EcfT
VILNQARETAEAQRARGVANRKNPAYRLTKLGLPLIRRTFENADRLVTAMESRCYSENRTGPALVSTRRDWKALFVIVASSFLMIFL